MRKRFFKLTIQQPYNVRLREFYRKFNNKLNSDIKTAKDLYFQNRFEIWTGNSRNQWRIVNELFDGSKEKKHIEKIEVDSNKVHDGKVIAYEFNKFVLNIRDQLRSIIQFNNPNANECRNNFSGVWLNINLSASIR